MKGTKLKISFGLACLLIAVSLVVAFRPNDDILTYTLDTKKTSLKFYWKDDQNNAFKSIKNLKTWLLTKNENLIFAMNGGMYKEDNSPQGLYIENSVLKTKLDTSDGKGNFYLKPNGVFYLLDDGTANICTSSKFKLSKNIQFATQSGPMLVVDGQINTQFTPGSKNVNIRNAVGILPDSTVIFAMSKTEINFHDFANYFKTLGCAQALYLDGFVSRTYLPGKNWMQLDGSFGVIIAVSEVGR